MADETPPPEPDRPTLDLRPGRPLDLSTGKPPEPRPEPPRPAFTPMPPAEGDPEVRAGQTLDFSTGKAPTVRRKPAAASLGAGPVVRETVDLSTARPRPAENAPPADAPAGGGAPASGPKPQRAKGPKGGAERRSDGGKKGRGRPKPTGNSLADLLDAETLARLRGGN